MIYKLINIFFLISVLIFSTLVAKYYFSDRNIAYINKSRSSHVLNINKKLPLLVNDTNNIIIYKNDLEEFKKKRKKRFWEKLISNINE